MTTLVQSLEDAVEPPPLRVALSVIAAVHPHLLTQIISSPILSCSMRRLISYTPFSGAGVITAALNFMRLGFVLVTRCPFSLMLTPTLLAPSSKRMAATSVTGRSRCQ